MLTELSVVEQRYLAVREALDGAKITDVAIRYGVDRRTVHRWLVRYATEGLGALADRSSRPDRCPIRPPPRSRPGSWPCADPIPAGGHGRSCRSFAGRWMSPRPAPRSTVASCGTA